MADFISTWSVSNGVTIVLPIINGTVLNYICSPIVKRMYTQPKQCVRQ
jgi:hypothetical protein